LTPEFLLDFDETWPKGVSRSISDHINFWVWISRVTKILGKFE